MIIPLLPVHIVYYRTVLFHYTTDRRRYSDWHGAQLRNRNLIPVRSSSFSLLQSDQKSSGAHLGTGASLPGCKGTDARRMFKNRVWKKIFRPNTKDMPGDRNCITRSFMIFTCHQTGGDQIKKIKMDGACHTYGGQETFIRGFGGET
jgi:hypothetical protein